MTDKELLQLAALAVGYTDLPIEGWTTDSIKGMRLVGADHEFVRYWNPLEDDGDALRLAVKLELSIDFAKWCNTVYYGVDNFVQEDWHNKDPYSATRLAIVRAAAEIGLERKERNEH